MPEVRLQRGEVDGLLLHYVTAGRGPAAVLVHGLGGFAESWRHNLEALGARFTVYAVDLPGFGRSGKPRARYTLTFFANAIRGFLDVLGIGRAALVGHSLGGAAAVTCALVHPGRVERLALVSAVVPGFGYRPSWPYRLAACQGLGELLALCGCAAVYRAALARCFHAPRRAEIDFLVRHAYGERTSWPARAAYLATLRHVRDDLGEHGEGYRRLLASLDLPVLLIHGRQDPVVPRAHCEAAARGLPRARVRWIDACGHFPQVEHAAVVNEWLADFLAGRPAPR